MSQGHHHKVYLTTSLHLMLVLHVLFSRMIPENVQWICHSEYNLLKIILQVIEDSKFIEGSSIIRCILA